MDNPILWFVFVGGGAIVLLFLGRSLIAEYFKAKGAFVDELVKKQKGKEHG